MSDFVIIGTDTDAGKTTFAALWLAAFAHEYEYWKPLETGPSDTETIKRLVPAAICHSPLSRFKDPVAPPLAAKREQRTIPAACEIAALRPQTSDGHGLVIETFGSPFSSLNEDQLQIALLQDLRLPMILASSSKLGAIGRTLQCWRALEREGMLPVAVVLLGERDDYAATEIAKHAPCPVVSLQLPAAWESDEILDAAQSQHVELAEIRNHLHQASTTAPDVADALLALDAKYVWHPYTPLQNAAAPLPIIGAQDEFLHLADGRRVIDGISSWWTILHGHRYPPLMQALHDAARDFDHVLFAGATHSHAVQLAELLLKSAGWDDGRVFFSDNGSTAVEVALKMAYQFWCHQDFPERSVFIGFENGYHGDTFGAMAAGRDPVFFGRFEPLLCRTEIVPVNAGQLDETLTKHKGEIAAVIIEPLVQGAGGMRMHSAQELRDIAQVTRDHDVLLIADEVMTAGGRLGSFWACHQAGIQPDLLCAAKTLAGGVLPLAATLASKRIVEAFDTADRSKTFFHGHSFTAHPLACAVAVANLNIMRDFDYSIVTKIEQFWREHLQPLHERPNVREVRIHGSIAAVEVEANGGYLADIGRHMFNACLERDVLLRPLGNVLYAMPPLGIAREALERIADTVICAMK